MPRLTNVDYLNTYRYLSEVWLHDRRLFANLGTREQWYLHDYFQPSKEWSDEELLAHRTAISKQHPSLPHQAGRALKRFIGEAERPVRVLAATPKGTRPPRGKITVKSVVRSEINMKLLARILSAKQRADIQTQLEQSRALIKEIDDWIEEQLDQAS